MKPQQGEKQAEKSSSIKVGKGKCLKFSLTLSKKNMTQFICNKQLLVVLSEIKAKNNKVSNKYKPADDKLQHSV